MDSGLTSDVHVSLRNAAALLVLAGAATLSWHFSRPPAEVPRTDDAAGGPPLGYYLRDATVLGTDESGQFLFRIEASEAMQNRDEDGLELVDVRVEYRDEQAVDWSIHAERAVTPDDRSYIDLEGVRLENEAPEGDNMVIESPRLRLDPDDYFAVTDGAVDIRVGNTTLGAVGLEARLREDVVELKSEVHGTYSRK